MRFTLAALLLVATAHAATLLGGQPAAIWPAARDEQGFLVHRVRSERQSAPTEIRVLLPGQLAQDQPAMDRLATEKRYPVLYVLPVEAGRGNRWGDGLVECRKLDLANRHGLICVAPTFADLPWYADHPTDPRIAQETYFVEEVVPFIDCTYPTLARPEGRLLVGFSKSGWGAIALLLRHADRFGKAAAWDAPLMMDRPGRYGSGPIFGTEENFARYQVSRLLAEHAPKFQGAPRLFHFGYGDFRADHQAADRLMNGLGIARHYRDGPQRKHGWHSGWMAEAVEWLVGSKPL